MKQARSRFSRPGGKCVRGSINQCRMNKSQQVKGAKKVQGERGCASVGESVTKEQTVCGALQRQRQSKGAERACRLGCKAPAPHWSFAFSLPLLDRRRRVLPFLPPPPPALLLPPSSVLTALPMWKAKSTTTKPSSTNEA